VVALAGSTVAAASPFAALVETSRWLQALGIFLMTLDLVRTRRALAGLVACLLIGGLSQAVLGLVQSFIGAGPESFAVAAGLSRAFGTFGMPNSYAGYLEMTLPLALALLFARWQKGAGAGAGAARRPGGGALSPRPWRRVVDLVTRYAVLGTGLLLLAGISFSFSRGAWLGSAVGIGVMVAVAGRRSLAAGVAVALLIGAVLGLGGGALLPATFTERLTSITESLAYRDVRTMVITDANFAVAERMAMWQAGLDMFNAHPLYGVGAGNYTVVYRLYNVPQFLYSRGHAHNYYIHTAAETGIIGLTAYGLVLLAAWLDVGRALRRLRDGALRPLAVGAAGILAAVMVHNIVENLHVLNMNIHFFAVLALPALALRVAADEGGTG
jgi:O-antigen ligase